MLEFLAYTFMIRAFIGGILIAILTGIIGPFLVLRRMSLLGDGLAHLSFGGVAIGLLFGINPFLTAFIFAILGSLGIEKMIKEDIYGDSAIAIILSFGVGLGVIIIGIVKGFNSSLFSYLIGSLLTLSNLDIFFMVIVLILTFLTIFIFFKQLFLLTFNYELSKINFNRIDLISSLFIVISAMIIVLSIKVIGILLLTALLVLPSLIGLTFSKSFKFTLFLSVIFNIISVIIGIILAFYLNIPPSGLIVMVLFIIFLSSKFIKNIGIRLIKDKKISF